MITREDFIYALEKLAKEGDIETLKDFYSPELKEEDRKIVENALIDAIRVARRNGKGFVLPILRRDDISDKVLLEAMEACRTVNWQIEPVANILRYKNKSDTVMIQAIEICAENGRISALNEMLNRKDLSDAVMIKLADTLAEKGWGEHVSMFLLGRQDISDAVRKAAKKSIERAERNDNISPKNTVMEYLGKNKLAGDGILSESSEKMRRGPAVGKKERGKIKT